MGHAQAQSPAMAPAPQMTLAPAPALAAPAPPPLTEAEFADRLRSGDLEQLDQTCLRVVEEGGSDRLRRLRARLLEIHPAPQPLPVVLANADVLLSCRAPEAALAVLDRYGPAAGGERVQWLVLQWRAATAALDHRRASLALERLAGSAGVESLGGLNLPVLRQDDGTVVSRPALEILAGHLESRDLPKAAAEALLASRAPGVVGAERLQLVVHLLREMPLPERQALLEEALDQAAAVGAWGLAAELLDDQAALPSERARGRRLRLSPRIDDAYGEWRLRREDPADATRSRLLEGQLRSPRSPGGHATEPFPLPAEPMPAPVAPRPAPPAPATDVPLPFSLP
jgi:hypothetical protein